jgi:N-acetylglucosaminyldiphosphoundecaprenol N-acetyl-beta-D-mannosaminyltransferase
MAKKHDQTVLLFENHIFSKSKNRLLKILRDKVMRTKKPLTIFTPNPEQLVLAAKDPQFQQLLEQADYLVPDGIGLVLASRILNLTSRQGVIFERISGIDLAADFLEWGADEDWPVLLLGGKDYHQAENQTINLPIGGQAAGNLQLQWLEGYQNAAQPTKQEEQSVSKTLQALKPKVVLVAFGAPKQEQWVVDHLDLLQKSGVKLVMVVGGTFDVLFGRLKRAPLWMRALGLEWLYRLIQEPHRWRRQLALLEFMGMVLGRFFIPKKT